MKKYLSYLGASLVAIAALSSCNKELTDPNEGIKGGIPFEITAASVDTKTTINDLATSWEAGDAINLFHAKAGSTAYTSDGKFTIAAEDLDAKKFKGTLPAALAAGNYDWYAFYPYKQQISSPGSQTDGFVYIGHSVAIVQNGNDSKAHLCGSPCPLYGVSKSIDASSPVSLEMKHLTSVVEINVTNSSNEPLTVSNITLSTDEDIVGSYYINITGENVVYTPSGNNFVKTVANLNVNNGVALTKGKTASFYIPIKPHVAENGSSINISVNGYNKSINLTKDVTFTAGKIKKINFNYDNTAVGNSVTFDFSDPVSLGLTKPSADGSTDITSEIVKGDVTLSTTNGGTNTRIYNSSGTCDLRVYKNGGSLTFSVPDGSVITRIVVNGATSGYTASVGTLTSGTWTGSNQSVKFTAIGTLKISSITVTYSLGKAATSIISDDITGISARGGSALESSYTIENPVDGKTITATCDGTVVTDVEADAGTILYTVSANTTKSAREGTITLTYGDVIKDVKVSQLAPVFKVSRTEIELEAAANSSSNITVTSDFDWMSGASEGAGFTSTPTTCEWTTENQFTDGKTTVTITATAENASKEGTKTLGTLTFTNMETSEQLVVTVTQKTSYVAPVLGNIATGSLSSGKEGVTLEEGKKITYSDVKKGTNYAEYTPGRFYAPNEFVVSSSAGEITSITITCSSTSYATVLETTMKNSKLGTVSKSSTNVSLKLTTPATTVTLTNSAQWRGSSMTVEYN